MGNAGTRRRARLKPKHIFCLEGDWWGDPKESSTVRPIFDLVSQMYRVKYIHRCVATREEFDHYLTMWGQRRYADHPILYLAFHGSQRTLHVGDGRRTKNQIDIDEIALRLRGRCRGRIIHFATCDTVGCDRRHLRRFLAATGATALSGYRFDVGWIDSAAFEVFLLAAIQEQATTPGGFAAVRRRVFSETGQLARSLGFRLEVSP